MPWSLDSYEEFVYRIRDYSPHISFSTLVLQRRGKLAGVLEGEIAFAKDVTLVVFGNLNFLAPDRGFIVDYGYEVKSEGATQYWYDSQPHLNDSTLQATHPHHKHIPPDIKHHRILASGLSFNAPNLPFLIHEIENLFFNTGEN
jgi:hypothetical protein